MLGLSQSTVSYIVQDISLRIVKTLKIWFEFTSADKVKYAKRTFYEISRFPGINMAKPWLKR